MIKHTKLTLDIEDIIDCIESVETAHDGDQDNVREMYKTDLILALGFISGQYATLDQLKQDIKEAKENRVELPIERMDSLEDLKEVENTVVYHYPDGIHSSIGNNRNDIKIDHEKETITYKLMTKPASEGGKGVQLTTPIRVSLHQLKYFNSKFPCDENRLTISALEMALECQEERTKNREARGVEGKNEQ